MSFGGAIKLTGEEEYRKALQRINLALKDVGAAQKLAAAEFESSGKDFGATCAYLEKANSALVTTLSLQREKLEALKKQYADFSVQHEQSSESHQQLIKKFEAEQEKLKKIKQTAGEASTEYKKQEKVVDDLRAAVKKSTETNERNERAVAKVSTALKKAETEVVNTENSISKLNAEMEKNEEAAKKAGTEYGKLKTTLSLQEKELAKLKEKYLEVALSEGKNSESAQKLAGKIRDLSAEIQQGKDKLNSAKQPVEELERSLATAGTSAEKAGGGFTVLRGAIADFIAHAAMSAMRTIADLGKNVVTAGMDFEAGMSKVQALSQASGEDLEKLTAKAQEMGATTKFTATESADAFSYMALAGWKTNDMLDAIAPVLNTAAASGENLGRVSDIITDSMTAFGLSSKEAAHFSDVLAAATTNSNTTIGMLGETSKYAAPLFGTAGQKVEDFAVAAGLMANAGIKGSESGTALRKIFTRLVAPVDNSRAAMEDLGIAVTNADGTVKPFSEVMDDLRAAFGRLTEAEKEQYAKMLAGQEAMGGLLAIVKASPTDYNNLVLAVNNCDGAAEKMAKTMENNAKGGVTKLKSNLESLQIELYKQLAPAIKGVIEFLNKLVDVFKVVASHSEEIGAALKIAAAGVAAYFGAQKAIQLVTGAWDALHNVQLLVTAAQNALNLVMSANPIGLVAGAVAAGVTAYATFSKKTDEATEAQKKLNEELKKDAEKNKQRKEQWDALTKSRQESIDLAMNEINYFAGLKRELSQLVDSNGKVKKGYEERANYITNELKKAFGVEAQMVDGVIKEYGKYMASMEEAIKKKKADALLEASKEQYQTAIKSMRQLSSEMKDYEQKAISAEKKVAEATEKFEKAKQAVMEDTSDAILELRIRASLSAKKEVEEAQKNADEIKKNLAKKVEAYNEAAHNIAQYEHNQTLALQKEYDKMSFLDYNRLKNFKSNSDAQLEVLKVALEDEQRAYATYSKKNDDASQEAAEKHKRRIESIKAEMKQYVSTNAEALEKTHVLWREGLDKDLSLLTGANIKFKEDGQGNVQAYVDGIASEEKVTTERLAALITAMLKEIAKRAPDAKKAGEQLIEGVNAGVTDQNKQSGVFASLSKFASGIVKTLQNALGIHSPSKKTKEMGENLASGLKEGVEESLPDTISSLRSSADSCIKSLELELSPEKGFSIMQNALKEMKKAAGIGGNEVNATVKNFLERMKNITQEQLPDFLKEGESIAEQLKKGIKNKENDAEEAAKDLAKNITNSLKKELSKKEFRSAIEKAVEEMKKFLDSNGNDLYQKATAYLKKIEEASKDQHPALIAEGEELLKSIGKGIDEVAPEVVDKSQKFCEKFISTLDKNITAEVGIKKIEELLEGFGIGIEKEGNEIYKKIAELAEKIAKTPQEQRETLRGEAQALMEEFKKGVLAKKEELKESMDQTIDNAMKPVLKKFSSESARKIVEEWRDGLLKTTEASAPELKKQFEKVGQAVKDCYAGKISKKEAARIIDEFMSATEETVKSKTSKVANAVKDVAEKATDELVKSFEKVEESKTKAMETNLALMQNSTYLFDELHKIVDVNGRIQSGYEERAKFITGELHKAFDIEIKTVGGVIQGYDKLRGSVDEVIKRKEAQIILDSQETGYKEAIQNQSKAVEALNETEQKLKENREKRQKVEKERSEFLEKLSNSRNEVNKKHYKKRISRSTKVLKQLDSETNLLQKMYDQQKELVQKYAFNIGQYTSNLEKSYSGSYEKMSTATWDFVKQYGSASLATKKYQEKQKEEYERHLEILKELKKKSGSDMYDSQIANDEKILAKLNENLKKYNKTASDGFNEAGSESAKSFAEGIDSSGESAKESAKSMLDSALEELKNEEPEMKGAGKNLGYSVSKGLSDDDVLDSIQRSGRNAGEVAAQALRDALDIHSPSKVGKNIGKNFGYSVGDGIDEGSKKAVEKTKKLGANLERTLKEKLNKATNTITIEKLENLSKALTMANRETSKFAKLPLVSASNIQATFDAQNSRLLKPLTSSGTTSLDYDRLYSATLNGVRDGMAKVSVNLDGDAMGKFVTDTVVHAVYN